MTPPTSVLADESRRSLLTGLAALAAYALLPEPARRVFYSIPATVRPHRALPSGWYTVKYIAISRLDGQMRAYLETYNPEVSRILYLPAEWSIAVHVPPPIRLENIP